MSFNPGGGEDETPRKEGGRTATGVGGGDDDDDDGQPTYTPKPSRLGLSNAAQSLLDRGEGQDHDRVRDKFEGDRPTYSKAYLDELRNSTPSTPHDLSSARASPSLDLIDPSTSNTALDLESKFGKTTLSSSSHIPSAAEIREKKERRARLAKEQAANATSGPGDNTAGADFISLEDYDSDGEFKPRRMQVGMYSAPPREKDTRLVRDDEDLAEGFDEFVDDPGRVTLSRKAQREQTLREREAMRALIDQAEGSGASSGGEGGSDSDSDYDRHRHYETAQTHRGMDGLSSHAAHTRQANRPRQPRETTAIPKLSAGLARLRDTVSHLEFERARVEKRRADIARERADIRQSQAHIQTSLEEAGQELERVTKEHLAAASSSASGGQSQSQSQSHTLLPANGSLSTTDRERGLESLGSSGG